VGNLKKVIGPIAFDAFPKSQVGLTRFRLHRPRRLAGRTHWEFYSMKHAGTAFLVVMLFSTLGLWGIAQQKNGAYASRLRDLETRHAKIEDDQKSFTQQSERNQRRIAALEVEKAELTQAVEELKVVVAERDELKKQLTVRTHERNDLRTLLDARTQERDTKAQELKQFAQELQSLLGRMDSTIAAGQRPVGPTVAVPVSRRPE